MLRNIAAIALALSLFACAGPQAFAQPGPVPGDTTTWTNAPSTPAAAPVVVAPAPSIAPIVNEDGTFNFTPLVDGIIKLVGAAFAVVATWVLGQATPYLKTWLGIHIDTKEVIKDLNVTKYADTAAAEVIGFAFQQTGFSTKDLQNIDFRNPFLQTAAALLFKLDPKVWRWVSTQEQTVIQWLESKLPAEAALAKRVVDGTVVPGDVAAAVAVAPKPAA